MDLTASWTREHNPLMGLFHGDLKLAHLSPNVKYILWWRCHWTWCLLFNLNHAEQKGVVCRRCICRNDVLLPLLWILNKENPLGITLDLCNFRQELSTTMLCHSQNGAGDPAHLLLGPDQKVQKVDPFYPDLPVTPFLCVHFCLWKSLRRPAMENSIFPERRMLVLPSVRFKIYFLAW